VYRTKRRPVWRACRGCIAVWSVLVAVVWVGTAVERSRSRSVRIKVSRHELLQVLLRFPDMTVRCNANNCCQTRRREALQSNLASYQTCTSRRSQYLGRLCVHMNHAVTAATCARSRCCLHCVCAHHHSWSSLCAKLSSILSQKG
jgi:hypothetical protein